MQSQPYNTQPKHANNIHELSLDAPTCCFVILQADGLIAKHQPPPSNHEINFVFLAVRSRSTRREVSARKLQSVVFVLSCRAAIRHRNGSMEYHSS